MNFPKEKSIIFNFLKKVSFSEKIEIKSKEVCIIIQYFKATLIYKTLDIYFSIFQFECRPHPLFCLDKVVCTRQDVRTRLCRSGLHFLFHKKKQMTLSRTRFSARTSTPALRMSNVQAVRMDVERPSAWAFDKKRRMDLTKSNRFADKRPGVGSGGKGLCFRDEKVKCAKMTISISLY